jgi:hypothetical protein
VTDLIAGFAWGLLVGSALILGMLMGRLVESVADRWWSRHSMDGRELTCPCGELHTIPPGTYRVYHYVVACNRVAGHEGNHECWTGDSTLVWGGERQETKAVA